MRSPDLESGVGIVRPRVDADRGHAADVVRRTVVVGNGEIGVGFADVSADIVSTVEMVERRDRQYRPRADGVQPGEIYECVALVFYVTDACGLLVGIVGNLVVVAAQRSHQAELVLGSLVENYRSEAAKAGGLIMNDLRARGFEAEIGAVSGHAAVVGEAVGVVSEADLIVRCCCSCHSWRRLRPGGCARIRSG